MPRVYVDSCLIIYLLEGTPSLRRAVADALAPAEGTPRSPCFSDLTRLECRVGPLRAKDQQLLARYDTFFAQPGLLKLPMTAEVFDLATRLRAQHQIRTPDALHLAAAMVGGCEEFWTNDARLAAAGGERMRVRVPFG